MDTSGTTATIDAIIMAHTLTDIIFMLVGEVVHITDIAHTAYLERHAIIAVDEFAS